MTKRQMDEVLRDTSDRLEKVERHLDKMQTILMVREPSSAVAAEAYDGLRKQVAGAMSERVAHLTQLVQFAAALAADPDVAALDRLVSGWLESASLLRITDAAHPAFDDVFELVEDLGGPVEILEPAYVDGQTGRVIRLGRARRRQPEAPRPAGPKPTPEAPSADSAGNEETDQ